MTPNSSDGRQYENITGHRYYSTSLIALFFLLLIGYFIAWPIVLTDTDLWYHLSGGRYFWQHGTIAHDAFFSYVTPPKSWYNYYWLFQAIVYKIFQWTDYYGLVVLRCLLYFLTALFICLSFIRRHDNRTELLLGLFLFVACTSVILYRETAVRPHLFSYLFIVVFLYILEFKREKIWLLPLLGIFWSNLHGIEYPVMFLIVFAYLAEIYWRQFRKMPTGDAGGKKENWLMIAVFYTIFITPGVIELVQTPFSTSFQNSAFQHLYVAELIPIPFQNFFIFAPVSVQGLIAVLQNLIVLLAAAFLLIGLWKRKLRLSHAILFIGAILMLAKHSRFTYEFTLLSIPLLRQGVRLLAENDRLPRRIVNLALPVVVVILPLLVFHSTLGNRPAYPFTPSNLPTGIVRFLNQNATKGGKILNEANTGGYLPWALSPKFKIYMDMQMSVFSDTDFATANNAFFDVNAFKAFIQKYDPSFISVSLNVPRFKSVVANDTRFVPVFFDQAELLYVNKSHYADLAERYTLKAIEPFSYAEVIYADVSPGKLAAIFSEASRMLDQDPANYRAHHILSSISVVRKQYDKALFHAEAILQLYPEQSHGYALKGDALFWMGRYEEAARLYKKALDMGRTSKAEHVYWNLHASYNNLKEHKKAYEVLSKYVNPFNPNADYKEIYQLGMSAASVGKAREAVTFLKIARIKAPPSDTEYTKKIKENLLLLDPEGKMGNTQ
ncbi:MAG: tetratricopeptide repeat protein [Syntrophus sp. (in: bacteria)]